MVKAANRATYDDDDFNNELRDSEYEDLVRARRRHKDLKRGDVYLDNGHSVVAVTCGEHGYAVLLDVVRRYGDSRLIEEFECAGVCYELDVPADLARHLTLALTENTNVININSATGGHLR